MKLPGCSYTDFHMRVLIAGGGTGGHVIPALAIARELKTRHAAEVLFVGTARGIENRLVPLAGFGLARVKVGALKNVSLLTRMRTLFDLPRAVVDARKIIKVFHPDVVVGVGGYASGPAMAAAIMMHIPTLAFEPNYVPGFANKIVGHRVSAAAVHFEQTESISAMPRSWACRCGQSFLTCLRRTAPIRQRC
jgi:UDP-N-acetylglucosamine--N-acetylmuramyl-(pentapeptide) pyrophosphoryl-undecaprenol N-acetylglucosamine transferase